MKDNKILKFVFEFEQRVFIVLFAVFLIGLAWGSYSLCSSQVQSDTVSSFINSPIAYFTDTVIKNLLSLLVVFLLGYTVIGFPFIFFCVLYNGICTGVYISLFTVSYGIKGCVVSALIFLPYFFFAVLSQMFVAFSSLRLTAALYNVFKDGTRYISPKSYSKPHILKFATFSAITAAATALYSFVALPVTFKIL